MHGHVVFEVGETRTFRVVHEQRLVAEHAAPGDIVANAEIVIEGGKSLPGELASYAEATDVTACNKIKPRRKLVAQPQADKRDRPNRHCRTR